MRYLLGPRFAVFISASWISATMSATSQSQFVTEQLAQGERNVETLAERVGLSIANASQHLQHMRRAGLIAARREGKFVFYFLTDDAVLSFLASIRRIAELRSAEVERVVRSYFDARDSLEAVTRSDLFLIPDVVVNVVFDRGWRDLFC